MSFNSNILAFSHFLRSGHCKRQDICPTMRMLLLAKTVLQLILLNVFIFMYAIPAFQRFIKHETIVLKSVDNREGIEAPSITIVAFNPETAASWRRKPQPEDPQEALTANCKTYSDVEHCLDAETFRGQDLIKDTLIGFKKKLSLGTTAEIWQSDFTQVYAGRSYTLDLEIKIGPNYSQDQLFVLLDQAYTHTIRIHDKGRLRS